VLAAGIDSPVAAAQQAVAAFLEDNKSASKEAKLQAAAEAEAQGDAAKAAALRAEVASSKVGWGRWLYGYSWAYVHALSVFDVPRL